MSYTWSKGTILDTYTCDKNEEYRTDPIFEGHEGSYIYTGVKQTFNPNRRYALYINLDNNYLYSRYDSAPESQSNFTIGIEPVTAGISEISTMPIWADTCEVATNIPIFEFSTDAVNYINAQSDEIALEILQDALNYLDDETEPTGVDFKIINAWTTGEWTQYGAPAVTSVNYRCLRGRIVSGRMCYTPVAGIVNGCLKNRIISNAEFYGLETSTDGTSWTPVPNNQLPFDFFYRKRVDELGEFSYALTFDNTGLPRFEDPDDADDYIDGILNESDADNWDEISDSYPDPQITIGNPDDQPTDMGEVYTRAFFSQQYICSASAMSEIANALFDTNPSGLWEDIKKGLEMYGDSPVDDIQGCMFFPFDLSSVFHNTQSQNYIYFGGYKFDLQNNSVLKILYPNGYIDFGSFFCKYRFNGSFRDYAPYRRLTVYLPYVGWAELDIKRYIGKTVSVRYYIDTRTGGCMACLFADGILYDYFNGQIGISMQINANDFVT